MNGLSCNGAVVAGTGTGPSRGTRDNLAKRFIGFGHTTSSDPQTGATRYAVAPVMTGEMADLKDLRRQHSVAQISQQCHVLHIIYLYGAAAAITISSRRIKLHCFTI
jgi:hypothetical protein